MTDFHDIISQTKNPIIVTDHNGVILNINKAFEKQYNWSSDALTGQLLSAIIPKNLRDAHNLGFSRFLITENPSLLGRELVLEILTGEGTVVKARHFIAAHKNDNGWVFAARINPV